MLLKSYFFSRHRFCELETGSPWGSGSVRQVGVATGGFMALPSLLLSRRILSVQRCLIKPFENKSAISAFSQVPIPVLDRLTVLKGQQQLDKP